MKCEDIQIGLNDFIDNELGFKNSQIIKKHIDECKHCFREAECVKGIKNNW
jgi:hypothetical protein